MKKILAKCNYIKKLRIIVPELSIDSSVFFKAFYFFLVKKNQRYFCSHPQHFKLFINFLIK